MTKHSAISYTKSGIRLVGYFALGCVSHHPCITLAAVVLAVAELLGIAEEWGATY